MKSANPKMQATDSRQDLLVVFSCKSSVIYLALAIKAAPDLNHYLKIREYNAAL